MNDQGRQHRERDRRPNPAVAPAEFGASISVAMSRIIRTPRLNCPASSRLLA